jgi:hypothetical protein
MNIFQTVVGFRHLAIIACLLLAWGTWACAPTEGDLSTQEKGELIAQLRAAKELDLSRASEVRVGPVAAGDYMLRADRADDVIGELERGVDVSRSEVSAALFVPPESLSETQRNQLVQKLEQARRLDDRCWRDWTREPVIAENFLVQERKADRVIYELETDQPVSWHDIQEAMQVPPNY